MNLIDFDARYAEYAEIWVRENMKRYKSIEKMEAELPEVYLRWINQKQDFLSGKTPAEHFLAFTDANELANMLCAYIEQRVDVPDLLLERIVDLGQPSVAPLMEIAGNDERQQELRALAMNLMIELSAREAIPLCLRLIDAREDQDPLADVAAELLQSLGQLPVDDMRAHLDDAGDDALATYLDLLSRYPDERAFALTLRQFRKDDARRALYAILLGKLGDARALPDLLAALNLTELGYLDYIEIRNAVETLGGDPPEERSFDGDPDYESMRQL